MEKSNASSDFFKCWKSKVAILLPDEKIAQNIFPYPLKIMEIAKIKKTPAKEEKSKMKVKEPPLTPTPTKVSKMTQMNEKIKFRIIKTPIKIKK